MRSCLPLAVLALLLLAACGDEPAKPVANGNGNGPAVGAVAPGGSGFDEALRAELATSLSKARTFLLAQQEENGGVTDRAVEDMRANVSFTAMAVPALVAATPALAVSEDAAIRKALTFLVGMQREDGAIVDDPKWTNYCTSAAVAALASARIGEFRQAQSKAMAYLTGSQITDEKNEGSFGGFPYKDDQTADGSNAFIAASALESAGLEADSPVRKRMAKFAAGLQNRSESNVFEVVVTSGEGDERTVVPANDGGAFYRRGESKAGMIKRSDGTWELKSYGSMTYAVLKLMLFAGVGPEDARVKALVGWIANHWTVERNPGFEQAEDPESAGQQGYFYYLYTVARALDAYERASGEPLVVRDADGRKHDWRAEIARALLSRQAADGSWRNPVDRWMEGMQTLATCFAMQTFGVLIGRLD
ncbi:MAG: hypothetical protein O2894_02115 [Planctomycetota bacterium]|nr:hypothetical protein [Planctomycetota bacterium]